MTIDGHPHVEHDPLARQLHRPRLHVFRRERKDENADVEERQPVQPVRLAGGDMPIDGDLHEVRLKERGDGAEEQRDERDANLPPVRPQVRQQPPHQPCVVGLSENFVVVRAAHASSTLPSPVNVLRTRLMMRPAPLRAVAFDAARRTGRCAR